MSLLCRKTFIGSLSQKICASSSTSLTFCPTTLLFFSPPVPSTGLLASPKLEARSGLRSFAPALCSTDIRLPQMAHGRSTPSLPLGLYSAFSGSFKLNTFYKTVPQILLCNPLLYFSFTCNT